jgi:hypothetical protein
MGVGMHFVPEMRQCVPAGRAHYAWGGHFMAF